MKTNEDTTINEKTPPPSLIETVDKYCFMARKHVPHKLERTDEKKKSICSFCKKECITVRDGELEVAIGLKKSFDENKDEIKLDVPKKRPKKRWNRKYLFFRG